MSGPADWGAVPAGEPPRKQPDQGPAAWGAIPAASAPRAENKPLSWGAKLTAGLQNFTPGEALMAEPEVGPAIKEAAKRYPQAVVDIGAQRIREAAQAQVKRMEQAREFGETPAYERGGEAFEGLSRIVSTPKAALGRAIVGHEAPGLETAAEMIALAPAGIQAAGKLGAFVKAAREARAATRAAQEAKVVGMAQKAADLGAKVEIGGKRVQPTAAAPPAGPPPAGPPPAGPPPAGPAGPPPGGPPQRPPIAQMPTPPRVGLAQRVYNAGQAVRKVFAPSTVDDPAKLAASLLRSAGGQAARDFEETQAALAPFEKQVNRMSELEQRDLAAYVEGRSTGAQLWDPDAKPVADVIRKEMFKYRNILENMPSTDKMSFVEDYLAHQWLNPNKAKQFYQGWAKQGRTGPTKKRSLPTMEDGIKAGLVPVTTNPVESALHYASNMSQFIAANTVVDKARKLKTVKYFKPGSKHVPDNWRPLQGRLGTKQTPVGLMQGYAPENFARVYNNFISKGFHQWEMGGKVFDNLQRAKNGITALELGLSGFHLFTVAGEAGVSQLAAGIDRMIGGLQRGSLSTAAKGLYTASKATVAPVSMAFKGGELQRVYLGKKTGSPLMAHIADLLTEAGGRAVDFRHDPTYQFSAMKSFWNSWQKGTIKAEAKAAMMDIKAHPLIGPTRQFARLIGRTMTSIAAPLFEKYIPKVKDGAFYEAMAGWLEANPNAPHAAQAQVARAIWDSIDNRFGEMVSDNIFWNKMLKQTAQLGMRSFTWNLGTVSEIGGGAMQAARHPFSSLGYAGSNWSPRASYVVALPIYAAMLGAVYQYLKTGRGPESLSDLATPKTGGTAPGVPVPSLEPFQPSERRTVDERAQLPGYMKDVLSWYFDPMGTAENKVATAWEKGKEAVTGRDWRGLPIFDPAAAAPEQIKQYFDWVMESFGPISIRQFAKGEKVGSNISRVEQLLGIRPAASYMQDPKGYREGKLRRGMLEWRRKQAIDAARARLTGE